MLLDREHFERFFEGRSVKADDTRSFFASSIGDESDGDGRNAKFECFGRADGVNFFVGDVLAVEPVHEGVAVNASWGRENFNHTNILIQKWYFY